MRRDQIFEPLSDDAERWRNLANVAALIGTGKSRAWAELARAVRHAHSAVVFGQGGRGNVCLLLKETCEEAATSVEPERFFDEMTRLADEVMRRHESWAAVRAARRAAMG